LGWIGVDLFFVISGFLIAGILLDTAGEPNYYSNFLARRSLRIFPLYYLFLLILFIVVPHAEKGAYFTTEFIRQSGHPLWYFLYLGNIREAIIGHEPAYFLAPLWSLSIEEQFYITFPFVVAALGRKRLRSFLCTLVVAAPLFRLASALLIPVNERIQYLATPSRVDVISLGALLALGLRTGDISLTRRQSTTCVLVMMGLLIVAFSLGGLNRVHLFCRVAGYSLVAFTFSASLLWAILHRDHSLTAILRFPALTHVGRMCYGIYLLQRPAEVLLLKSLSYFHVTTDAASPFLMLGKMLTAILVGSGSWYLFESPILKLKRYFVARGPSSRESQMAQLVLAD
jgi:peptidoglycan/LPS O-acetylase OafA/YrhL